MARMKTGKIMITPRLVKAMEADTEFATKVNDSIARYKKSDWGDQCQANKNLNNIARDYESKVLGSYEMGTGTLLIITEADRKTTTVMFAEEY